MGLLKVKVAVCSFEDHVQVRMRNEKDAVIYIKICTMLPRDGQITHSRQLCHHDPRLDSVIPPSFVRIYEVTIKNR